LGLTGENNPPGDRLESNFNDNADPDRFIGALDEASKSGRGQPHSKTQAFSYDPSTSEGFGVRLSSAALTLPENNSLLAYLPGSPTAVWSVKPWGQI